MSKFKALLVGLGKIGSRYAEDPAQVSAYQIATHAQALRAHPAFELIAGVDPDAEARSAFHKRWGIEAFALVRDLPAAKDIDLVVLATPPQVRTEIVAQLPNLRAAFVEKPLAAGLPDAAEFLRHCRDRGIAVSVNLTRRFDTQFRELASGGLVRKIGRPMAAFATYGNGLVNNGTHLVDLVRMIFGDVNDVCATPGVTPFAEGPTAFEINFPFTLRVGDDLAVMVSPLRFSCYREVGLDIWGESGRLQLMHESATVLTTEVGPCRALSDARELRHENTDSSETSFAGAFYRAYENLADVMSGRGASQCSGDEAFASMQVVEAARRSAADGGRPVVPGGLA